MYAGGDAGSVFIGRLEALYQTSPRERTTAYLGGGLSLAAQQESSMTGSGPRAEGTAGVEFARDSAIHMFLQLDVALPFYTVDTSYSPTASASFGLGF
jgi:hypothetical protein